MSACARRPWGRNARWCILSPTLSFFWISTARHAGVLGRRLPHQTASVGPVVNLIAVVSSSRSPRRAPDPLVGMSGTCDPEPVARIYSFSAGAIDVAPADLRRPRYDVRGVRDAWQSARLTTRTTPNVGIDDGRRFVAEYFAIAAPVAGPGESSAKPPSPNVTSMYPTPHDATPTRSPQDKSLLQTLSPPLTPRRPPTGQVHHNRSAPLARWVSRRRRDGLLEPGALRPNPNGRNPRRFARWSSRVGTRAPKKRV